MPTDEAGQDEFLLEVKIVLFWADGGGGWPDTGLRLSALSFLATATPGYPWTEVQRLPCESQEKAEDHAWDWPALPGEAEESEDHQFKAPFPVVPQSYQGMVIRCLNQVWISEYNLYPHVDELKSHGFLVSMARAGNPCENAMIEGIFETLKCEEVYLCEY